MKEVKVEYREVLERDAPLSVDEVSAAAAAFVNAENTKLRLAAFDSLARSGRELVVRIKDGDAPTARSVAELAVAVEAYADRLADFMEMMKLAAARLRMSLEGREDKEALLATAEAPVCGKPH